ncbi:MAG: DUF1553 domain-containing protein [Verrucomicrobia bacterium]|nr:DUF1553 domain-containing protein [Verrucomicrobiota bacterium]
MTGWSKLACPAAFVLFLAPDAEGAAAKTSPANAATNWWSLKPIVRPVVPILRNSKTEIRNPIDAFIVSKLREKGLSPSPEADARTLIRRLHFGLVGLPPAPEDVEEFASTFPASPRPSVPASSAKDAETRRHGDAAIERLVDRLLASPRHGERWARHWLDVARFAETHGHDQDRVRENAWPYRDYVIESLNADKPWARFVQEQVAADALFPGEPRLIPALGFLAAGPWDESSLRDIREDTLDREIGRYLDRDDIVTAVMSAFASSSVHCARCHDHKFDPIPQRDYYSLQAVFAGVEKANRAFDPDPAISKRRADLRAKVVALEKREPAFMEALLTPAMQADVEAWLARELAAARLIVWTTLTPESVTSLNGSKLVPHPDGSVLATGGRPEKDTYTFVAATELRGITGVRLEVLTDDSLPKKGPGRQDNGNLHLTEFKAGAAPQSGGEPRAIAFQNPLADFNQQGWTIQHALDNKPATAWGIYPEVGKSHQAVFEFAAPLANTTASRITFVLEQLHGGGHLIGRFRISVTTAPRPLSLPVLPDALARLASTPPADRTPAQRQELAAHWLKEKLTRELAAMPKPQLVFAAASDFEPDGSHKPPMGPRPVHMLRRGEIGRKLDPASPGALDCVAALPARFDLAAEPDESARRASLALWLTDPQNPLVWRSIVNRVWQHHFGRGLVDTPNDFGRMGSLPTHPDLLDWLAAEFRDRGGSLKWLHRIIVTSAAYRQASNCEPALSGAAAVRLTRNSKLTHGTMDADNRLLWRQNRTRLDAECVRDAMLSVSGQLDLTTGGPSARHFALGPGIHVTPTVEYSKFDWDSPAGRRRSVYRFVFRTLPDPFMEALDFADTSVSTPARAESNTPLQALAVWNNDFVLRQSEHFAARLERETQGTGARVKRAFALALNRAPTPAEIADFVPYIEQHGLAAFCRLLFNSSEFLFIN